MAHWYLTTGQTGRVRAVLDPAVTPQTPVVMLLLADCSRVEGDDARARTLYGRLTDHRMLGADACLRLANLAIENARASEALQWLLRADRMLQAPRDANRRQRARQVRDRITRVLFGLSPRTRPTTQPATAPSAR